MVTLTDTDIIRASWLDPDNEFTQVVETSVNVTTDIPSRDYTHPDNHTSPTYDMTHGSKHFNKITTVLNFHFHLRPTFTQKALCTVACVAGVSGEGKPPEPRFSPALAPLPPSPLTPATQAMCTAVAVYELRVTENCF